MLTSLRRIINFTIDTLGVQEDGLNQRADNDLPTVELANLVANSTWKKALWGGFYGPIYHCTRQHFSASPGEKINWLTRGVANLILYKMSGMTGLIYLLSYFFCHG